MMNTSVAISAAITAGARTHINYLLKNYDVYYTDTDSIFTSQILDKSLIL